MKKKISKHTYKMIRAKIAAFNKKQKIILCVTIFLIFINMVIILLVIKLISLILSKMG